MATLARTAQISASQEFQDLIDTDASYQGRHLLCVVDMLQDILKELAEQRLTVLVFAERRVEKSKFVFL